MEFIKPDLESVLPEIDKLDPDTKALWGSMSAQRMIEHLTDTLRLSIGIGERSLEIPEEKVERAKAFLNSEHPMPQNFVASFAKENTPLRNEDIALAIDELTETWIAFEEFFEKDPEKTILHPNFGELNYQDWLRLHSKHITHHLTQFGIR